MVSTYSTGRLQRPTLFVVACRPSTHCVGVRGNVRLRSRLRLVSDSTLAKAELVHGGKVRETRRIPCEVDAASSVKAIECNTCGREVVRREPGRKICPRCESYWIIVELVTMGRVNRQRALPFSASQILFGPRRRRAIGR